MDRRLGPGGRAGAGAGRVAVPERRRQAQGPLDGARRGAGGRGRTSSCRTSSTGSSRSPSRRRWPGARPGLADDLAVGHYKPINSERFLNDCHEFVFHFSRTGDTPLDRRAVGVKYQDKSNVTRWQQAGSGLRCRGNTWFLPYDTIQSRDKERPHPATFPCAAAGVLPAAARPARASAWSPIRSWAWAVPPWPARTLGVSFVGIELDEHYLKEAVARARGRAQEAIANSFRLNPSLP